MSGKKPTKTCGHNVRKRSWYSISEEYGLTGRSIVRYMRVSQLIAPLNEALDRGEIALVAAVDLSFLEEEEQEMVSEQMQWGNTKVSPKTAKELRDKAGSLDAWFAGKEAAYV